MLLSVLHRLVCFVAVWYDAHSIHAQIHPSTSRVNFRACGGKKAFIDEIFQNDDLRVILPYTGVV